MLRGDSVTLNDAMLHVAAVVGDVDLAKAELVLRLQLGEVGAKHKGHQSEWEDPTTRWQGNSLGDVPIHMWDRAEVDWSANSVHRSNPDGFDRLFNIRVSTADVLRNWPADVTSVPAKAPKGLPGRPPDYDWRGAKEHALAWVKKNELPAVRQRLIEVVREEMLAFEGTAPDDKLIRSNVTGPIYEVAEKRRK